MSAAVERAQPPKQRSETLEKDANSNMVSQVSVLVLNRALASILEVSLRPSEARDRSHILWRPFVIHALLYGLPLAVVGESEKYEKGPLIRITYHRACCLELLMRATVGRGKLDKTRGKAQGAPAETDLMNSLGVSPGKDNASWIGQLLAALEDPTQTVCSLGLEEAHRDRDDPVVVRNLDVQPDESPRPTALSSIANWAVVEGQGDKVHALSSNMIPQIIDGDGMGHSVSQEQPEENEGEETVDGEGSSSSKVLEMLNHLGKHPGILLRVRHGWNLSRWSCLRAQDSRLGFDGYMNETSQGQCKFVGIHSTQDRIVAQQPAVIELVVLGGT